MYRIILSGTFILFARLLISQASGVSYQHDSAGNRTQRHPTQSQIQTDDNDSPKEVGAVLESTLDSLNVGLSDLGLSIKIFPNPLESQMTLQIKSELINESITIEIWSFSGQLVSSSELLAVTQQLDVSKLAVGHYVLKAKVKNETFEWPFVKQN